MKTGMPIRSVGLGLSLTSSRPDASWHNREERGREWRVQFTPVKANWLAPVFVPFPQRIRPPTGPAPVEARFGNHAPASRHRISGPHRSCTGRGEVWQPRAGLAPPHSARHRRRVAVGPKGRGKGWGTRCAASFQTGLPPVQDRWGARARKREIRPECDKLNTPGRESFSGEPVPTWLVVGRKRLPTPFRHLAGCLLVLLTLAQGVHADPSLEKRASWEQPTRAEVQQAIDQWLAEQDADELTSTRIQVLWSDEAAEAFDQDRLNMLVETIAILNPAAGEVLQWSASPGQPRSMPHWELLESDDLPAWMQSHLRLYMGRWLAQHALYDESLALIEDLQPQQVLDPATLLFYQGVGHHRMLQRDECLHVIGRLLENRGQIPRRYETVAVLMEADIQPLQPDSLDEVARLMDDIERRLGLGRAGTRVREQEDEVIAKLDKMIEDLEQQMQQAAAAAAAAAGGGGSSTPAPDSMPGGETGPGEVDPRRLGQRANWGNLPPRERHEALQQIAKDLPSHYREVIEEYFRKLARDGNQ